MRRKRVSIRDVARKAGYSITVVSHAFNHSHRVSPKTRLLIQKVAQQLGYRPDIFGRGLRTRRSHLIGVVVPGIVTSFYPEVINPIDEALRRKGYGYLLMVSYDSLKGEREAVESLIARQVEGVIIAPCKGYSSREHLLELERHGIPLVMIDRFVPGIRCSTVVSDNRRGAYLAVRHLLELGHRRIAAVKAAFLCSSTRERLQGYRQALKEFGIEFDPQLVFSVPHNIGRDMYPDGEAILGPCLSLDPPPTALFAFHDVVAISLMSAALARGMKLPDALSIVSYDDLAIVKHLPAPLTTVRQDKKAMGQTAVDILFEIIEGKLHEPRHIRLEPELVIRESSGPPAGPWLERPGIV